MMKRLFGPTLIEKAFIDSNIDKTHEMVFTKRIVDLANQFLSGSFQG